MPAPTPFVQILGEPAIATPTGRYVFEPDLRYHLLAYLAYHRSWISRERLARLFWPEEDAQSARHNLRQLLKRTRQLAWRPTLEAEGRHHDLRVRWQPPSDLAALDAAMVAGDVPGAVRLFAGGLLEGVRAEGTPAFAAWLEVERGYLKDRYRTWLSGRGRHLADAGRYAEATAVFARVLDLDALDEEAIRAYMAAAALAGQRQRALARYERFAAQLATELSLPPTATTEELARRIREGRLDATREGAIDAIPVGAAAGVPDGRVANQETAPVPLIGRDTEIGVLRRRLADPACRLLTVTGPGGVGKSVLGRYAAEALSGRFTDGVVQVGLHGASAAEPLPNAIARALTLDVGREVDPTGRLTLAIGRRQLLLFLDDVDALPGCAATIASLLERCRNLVVLVTARERLHLGEEWLLPLDGLAFPAAGAPLADAAATDSVRLFLRRAERLRPDHDLLEAELRHVVEICRLVGGLPLGIELAAAWVRTLSCEQIATAIAADLSFLARTAHDGAPRHASVRATFDHSWRNLTDDERRTLERLSVFRGRFDRLAASQVAGSPLAVLAALVDKSLLRSAGRGGYDLHPLLGRFAGERLAERAGEPHTTIAVHGRWLLRRLASCAEAEGEARTTGLAALDRDFDDLAAAWQWLVVELASPPGAGAAAAEALPDPVEVSHDLVTLCEARGRFPQCARLLGDAAAAWSASPHLAAGPLAAIAIDHAWLQARLGFVGDAERAVQRSMPLLPRRGMRRARRKALSTLGAVALQEGRYAAAARHFGAALRSATAHDARDEIASASASLGVVRQMMGDREGAARLFTRHLEVSRELGRLEGVVQASSNLGNVLRLLGRLDDARRHLHEALDLAERHGIRTSAPNLQINLGVLAKDLGQLDHAYVHFETALSLARELGRQALEITAHFQLGRLTLDQGDPSVAETWFLSGLERAESVGDRSGALDHLAGLAWTRWHRHDLDLAERWARAVNQHEASTPGTRAWARDLVELVESARRTAARPTVVAGPLADGTGTVVAAAIGMLANAGDGLGRGEARREGTS